jgi:hypothetical protein
MRKLKLTSIVCLFVLGYCQRVIIGMEKEVPTTYLSLTIINHGAKNNCAWELPVESEDFLPPPPPLKTLQQ